MAPPSFVRPCAGLEPLAFARRMDDATALSRADRPARAVLRGADAGLPRADRARQPRAQRDRLAARAATSCWPRRRSATPSWPAASAAAGCTGSRTRSRTSRRRPGSSRPRGSPLFADFVPAADSEVVRRIRARRRDRDRQDQRARVRLRLADLQRRLRPDPQPVRPRADRRRLERRGGGGARGGPGAGRRRERLHGLPAQPGRVLQRLRLPAVARAGRLAAARAGVRGPDRHRRADGPQPARPRRPAGHARRPAPRAAVLDRRGPGGPRRAARARRPGAAADRLARRPRRPPAVRARDPRALRGGAARARRRRRPGRPRLRSRRGVGRRRHAAPLRRHLGARAAARAPQAGAALGGRGRARGHRPGAARGASGRGPSVAAALRALLRDHDALALPSAQVFPFDVETHWPREIAGRPMPTYHRWMEVRDLRVAGRPARRRRAGRVRARPGCRWACS